MFRATPNRGHAQGLLARIPVPVSDKVRGVGVLHSVPVPLMDRLVVTVLLRGLPDSESVGVTVTEIDRGVEGVKVRGTVPVPVRVWLLEAVVL